MVKLNKTFLFTITDILDRQASDLNPPWKKLPKESHYAYYVRLYDTTASLFVPGHKDSFNTGHYVKKEGLFGFYSFDGPFGGCSLEICKDGKAKYTVFGSGVPYVSGEAGRLQCVNNSEFLMNTFGMFM